MRTHIAPVLGALFLAGMLAACNGDHTDAAEKLEGRLARLNGVASVSQDYEPGDMMFPGSAGLEVQMASNASDREVAQAVLTAFQGFKKDFGSDEGNALLTRGGDEILLHVQDTSARPAEVVNAVWFALLAREPQESLYLDVNANDDEGFENVESTLEFRLPRGSDRADVLPRFDRFDATKVPAHADILVRAADESALSGFDGLPSEQDRSVFRQLNEAPYATSYRVDYGPLNTAPGSSRSAMVVIDLKSENSLTTSERNRRRVTFMTKHLEVLSSVNPRFRYYVNKGVPAVVQLDHTMCQNNWKGWRGQVARYYVEHTKVCG